MSRLGESKLKVLTIIGARPQFIKAIALNKEFLQRDIEEVLVHTGQHYDQDMSEVFFQELGIPAPRYNLGIADCSHGEMTGRMVSEIEKVLQEEKPSVLLVYGDTNSTMAAAIAASKLSIPIAHVESGLRSFDRQMPEEINRVVTDHISQYLFCPTEIAINNLQKEGVYTSNPIKQQVFEVGDVMYDTFKLVEGRITEKQLEPFSVSPQEFALATIHRPSNTDHPEVLQQTINWLDFVSNNYKRVVFPMHPRTKARVKKFDIKIPDSIKVVTPLSYTQTLAMLKFSFCTITDSGGMQKEALWAKSPCVTVRNTTEWTETVDQGFNFLVGNDEKKFKKALEQIESVDFNSEKYNKLLVSYGKGLAAKKIVEILIDQLSTTINTEQGL